MAAFRIVLSLIKVPRLFAALLLFPILGALLIVFVQLFFTASTLTQISSAKNTDSDYNINVNWDFLRLILFSDGKPLAEEPKICIWQTDPSSSLETFPSADCAPDRLDVAIHHKEEKPLDLSKYVELVRGNSYRLHVCKDCRPDLEFFESSSKPEVKIHSIYGLILYQLILKDTQIESKIKELRRERNLREKGFGEVSLNLSQLHKPTNLSAIDLSIVIVLNITSLAVIALWLGLKAHRKVLDYFSKSGALLPMVAATGKKSFYSALWIITGLRVLAFLLASVPLLIFTLLNSSSSDTQSAVDIASIYFLIWLAALISGLSLATIIASISDLKGRHELLSIMYKLVPLLLSILGGIIWLLSFLGTGDISVLLRNVIVALPIVGLGPLILSQVVQVHLYLLIIHILLSLLGCQYLLKRNTHWFAAHLEEL
jgi:hypothetical protein